MDNTEKYTLEDGRLAQRRTYLDEDNNEVSEIYVEPPKDLVLEKRVITKRENVVAEQVVQTIKDNKVVDEEIHSVKPDLTHRSEMYVTKEVLDEALNGLVARLSANAQTTAVVTPVEDRWSAAVLEEDVFDPRRDGFGYASEPIEIKTTGETKPEPKILGLSKGNFILSVVVAVQLAIFGYLILGG